MRAPAVSFVHKLLLVIAVGLLACGLALPQALAFAEGEDAPSALLASSLMDGSASVVREDVALAAPEDDAAPEPVIGSFTVDGLTFAVTEGSNVQLVGVSPAWQQAMGLQAEKGSPQPSMPASGAEGSDADSSALLLPETVAYNGIEYIVSSIGAYAFYLSGVTSVELPASVIDVDERAFRSSDVASVAVAEGNPNYSSFDGALYDADQSSLLLIPEGKQGTVLLLKTAESAAPSVFSHCPLVTQISVEEGSAAFASENGLLYDASLTTLLRVPAGATEITIREGCTTIAAGAMEACASLATINAPSSVTSISPYLLEQQPETVMAPVAVAATVDDGDGDDSLAEGEPADNVQQLAVMVALSSADDELPLLDADNIMVKVPVNADCQIWEAMGFETEPHEAQQDSTTPEPVATAQSSSTYALASGTYKIIECSIDEGGYFGPNTSSFGTYPSGSAFTQGVNESGATVSFSAAAVDPATGNSSITYTATSGSETKMLRVIAFPGVGYEVAGYRINGSPELVSSHSAYITGATQSVHVVVKKSTFLVNLDGNGADTPGTSAIYYWRNKGYIVDSDSTTVIAAGSTMVSSVGLPERAGYTFAGYWDTPDATGGTMYIDKQGRLTEEAEPFKGDGELHARWAKNPVYTIALKKNIGNDIASEYKKVYLWYDKGWYDTANPKDDTAQLSRLDISPSWAGRTYKGFSDKADANSGDYWADLSIMPSVRAFSSSQSLYAVWETNPVYKVTINSELGTGGTSEIYLWYGKGWYSESNPNDSSTAISTITFPWNPGYSPTGCWDSLTSSNRNRYVDADGSITAGVEAVDKGTTWHVGWSKKDSYTITLDKNGGSADLTRYYWPDKGYMTSADSTSVIAKGSVLVDPAGLPTREGWSFTGYYSDPTGGTCYVDSTGKLTNDAPALTKHAKWYAQWVTSITLYGNGDGAKVGLAADSSFTLQDGATDSFDLKQPVTSFLAYAGGSPFYFTAPGYSAVDGLPQPCVVAKRPGYAFIGWSYEPDGPVETSTVTRSDWVSSSGVQGVVLYAQWTPALSVDVPIEVTAQVDLLGIEDQVPASGYIESRCGAPLAVEEVSFTALAGAEDLFGEANTASVSLQALALEGDASWDASAPTFSFALDANATESDASKLAALCMEGYEDHIPIGYRFAIPEDVLASIDPARFEQVTTPVCSVSYTVALASA